LVGLCLYFDHHHHNHQPPSVDRVSRRAMLTSWRSSRRHYLTNRSQRRPVRPSVRPSDAQTMDECLCLVPATWRTRQRATEQRRRPQRCADSPDPVPVPQHARSMRLVNGRRYPLSIFEQLYSSIEKKTNKKQYTIFNMLY